MGSILCWCSGDFWGIWYNGDTVVIMVVKPRGGMAVTSRPNGHDTP